MFNIGMKVRTILGNGIIRKIITIGDRSMYKVESVYGGYEYMFENELIPCVEI